MTSHACRARERASCGMMQSPFCMELESALKYVKRREKLKTRGEGGIFDKDIGDCAARRRGCSAQRAFLVAHRQYWALGLAT